MTDWEGHHWRRRAVTFILGAHRHMSQMRSSRSLGAGLSTSNLLDGCVSSLSTSLDLLTSSIATLEAGTSDFGRIQRLLQNTRHFELTTEREVTRAKAEIAQEMEPQLKEVLKRVEGIVSRMERKEHTLKSKADLQQVRLQQMPSHPPRYMPNHTSTSSSQGTDAKAEEFKALRAKREYLTREVERLAG